MDAHLISTMGLLIGLMVVLTRFLGIETPFFRVSFDFVPQIVMGMLFGPFWTGVGSALADLIGIIAFGKAQFFIGFTLNAFISGAIYGFFFYKKDVTWQRAFLCTLSNTIIVSLILTPIWLMLMYSVPITSWAIWAPRLIKVSLMLPVQTLLNYFVGRAIPLKVITRNLRLSV